MRLELPKLPPQRFCLIRHGETTANRDGIIAGHLDVPLTEQGRSQARALSRHPWPEQIALFCSPLDRAMETARLGFPGHQATCLPGLRERHWGQFEGQPLDQLPPRGSTPPLGEPWQAMILRVHAALCQCIDAAGPALPVLVCHSGVIRATRLLTGQSDVGSRPPNSIPIHYRPQGQTHEEQLHEL